MADTRAQSFYRIALQRSHAYLLNNVEPVTFDEVIEYMFTMEHINEKNYQMIFELTHMRDRLKFMLSTIRNKTVIKPAFDDLVAKLSEDTGRMDIPDTLKSHFENASRCTDEVYAPHRSTSLGERTIYFPHEYSGKIRLLPTIEHVIQQGEGKRYSEFVSDLALSNLSHKAFTELDKEMKALIGYTSANLGKLYGNMTWDNLVECLNANPTLKPTERLPPVKREASKRIHGVGVCKCDGRADRTNIDKLVKWFVNFLADDDAFKTSLASLKIDGMCRLAAESGVLIVSTKLFFYGKKNKSKEVMNVNVLQLPDNDRPYVKLYNVKVSVWRSSTRILCMQNDRNGIRGEYKSVCFSPNREVLSRLDDDVIDAAVEEARALYS